MHLRLLTLNTWGLPAPLGKKIALRAQAITAAIQDYDLVLLQEVFHAQLFQNLQKSGFPHVYRHHNPGRLRQGSGLMLLSRFPLQNLHFTPFKTAIWPDRLAHKGLLWARVELGAHSLLLGNTHFQSGEHPAAAEVRQTDNLKVLQSALEQLEPKPDESILLGGDLNLLPDSEAHRILCEELGFQDLYAQFHPQEPGYTVHADDNPLAKERCQRIDYLLLQSPAVPVKVLNCERQFTTPHNGLWISDHFGLSADLELPHSNV